MYMVYHRPTRHNVYRSKPCKPLVHTHRYVQNGRLEERVVIINSQLAEFAIRIDKLQIFRLHEYAVLISIYFRTSVSQTGDIRNSDARILFFVRYNLS